MANKYPQTHVAGDGKTMTRRPIKENGYNSTVLHAKRDKKRLETKNRQQLHDTLTITERIEKAKSRRGNSKKEITKLEKLLLAIPIESVKSEVVKTEKKSKKKTVKV